jgi:arsenate reductase (thioredoxin)
VNRTRCQEVTMSKESVLFLCSENAARSQMAEAFLRKHGDDRYEALSAGMQSTGVHPLAIRVMNEIGIDISGQRSKDVKEYLGRVSVRHAIFLCEKVEKQCPRMFLGALNTDSWPFEDPAAANGTEDERLAKFRAVRDQIDARIKAWLGESSRFGIDKVTS